jgi:RNA polymerase sigma-70 factor (sigma-E family)
MGREPADTAVERLLAERGQHLMRAAVALTGSRADGEDLLQAALERLLRSRRRVDTNLEGYLRRTLYNLAADGWRRRGRWRDRLAEFRSQARVAGTRSADVTEVDLRDALVRLLQQLPPRQRAVVVLRYWEQRTEAETAALLGCTEGTVKSTAARGLRRLRELAGPWQEPGDLPAPPKRSQPRTEIEVAGGRP